MIEAIILAGGLGTRLSSVVPDRPKALALVGGIPFIDLVLHQLAQTGLVSRAVLAIGFQSEAILRHFEQMRPPLPVAFSIEQAPLGTGGALLNALPKTNGDTLLVLNGDCFSDLSFPEFFRAHEEKNADLTLVAVFSEELGRYGSIQFTEDWRIVEFREKSPESARGHLNAGIYLIQRAALLGFLRQPCSIETDLFPSLLSKNMFAFPHEGTFLDIGTPPSYELAQKMLTKWIPTSPAASMGS